MRVQKVAGMTMSPNPNTEKGYCLFGSVKAGKRNLTGASILVATVIYFISFQSIHRSETEQNRPRNKQRGRTRCGQRKTWYMNGQLYLSGPFSEAFGPIFQNLHHRTLIGVSTTRGDTCILPLPCYRASHTDPPPQKKKGRSTRILLTQQVVRADPGDRTSWWMLLTLQYRGTSPEALFPTAIRSLSGIFRFIKIQDWSVTNSGNYSHTHQRWALVAPRLRSGSCTIASPTRDACTWVSNPHRGT